RDDGAFGLQPEPDQPLYGPTFRAAAFRRGCAPREGLLRECSSLGQLRASLRLCVATRKQPEPHGCTRRLRLVLPASEREVKCARHGFDEYAAPGPTHRSFGSKQ